MRHAVRGRKLARTSAHRLALRRNLVQSLIEHGRIRTTLVKAREVRGFAEKLVSLAVDGSLAARQRAAALLNDRAIIPAERRKDYDRLSDAKREKVLRARSGRRHRTGGAAKGAPFTAEGVIHRLFSTIGPQMKLRNDKVTQRNGGKVTGGGYTRIIKLAERRLGDGGQLALLEFVKPDEPARPKGSDRSERKRRARVKYAFYAGKPLQRRGARRAAKPAEPAASAEGSEGAASS